MTVVSTLYNHKGGVSKTTSTFNLGHVLAESNFRVILVDADPQANLTELFMQPFLDSLDAKMEAQGDVGQLPGTSVYEALKPRLHGEIPRVDVENIQLVPGPSGSSLQLLRGDVNLNLAEEEFSTAHTQRLGAQVHYKYTYVAFYDMLKRLGEREHADFVLIDVGPSAGALTRACFLASDCFFVPVAPDRFNVQAISSLSSIINRWMNEHKPVVKDLLDLGLPTPQGRPLFLGTITQNYKLAKGQRPKSGFELWIDRIPTRVSQDLVPVLRTHSDAQRNLMAVCDANSEQEAARIPDFGSLVTAMQECAKPIFGLTPEDTKSINNGVPYTGVVWEDVSNRMANWRALFLTLAQRLTQVRETLRL